MEAAALPSALAQSRRQSMRSRSSLVLGGAAIAAGVSTLVGWASGVEILTTLLPGHIVMLPNTAVGFIAAGTSLVLQHGHDVRPPAKRAALALAILVVLLGGLTFLERAFGVDFGIDRLIFGDRVAAYPFRPVGRMATNSTIAMLCAGLGLLTLDVELRGGRRPAQWFATIGAAIGGVALVGHLYGARQLYSIDQAAGMALMTAITFSAVHFGILLARADRGGMSIVTRRDLGGALARKLVPQLVSATLLMGYLFLQSRRMEMVSRETGTAMLAVAICGLVLVTVVHAARALSTIDRERQALMEREAQAMREAMEARDEAERANQAKSAFLATMSHELRTPLNAIVGYGDLIAAGIAGPTTPDQQQYLGRVQVSAHHLLALIDDILSISRVEAGKETVTVDAGDVATILRETETLTEPLARRKGLSLNVRIPPDPIALETDVRKVKQALINLVTNAIKFTDRGSVTVDVSTTADRVVFAVRDTGIGIAADHIETIFAPFWQVEQSMKRTAGGAGLGLAVTRRFARLLGGDVFVTSEPGAGSTFTLEIPRSLAG